MAYNNDRRDRRNKEEAPSEFIEKVVSLNRVSKTVKGGRVAKFSALCVVGDSPVGCDVEAVPEQLDVDLCRYCCSDDELDAILHAGQPTLAFTTLWTKKEAFLKFTGQGLTKDLPALFKPGSDKLLDSVKFQTHIAPDGSYVYSTVTLAGHPLAL